MITGLFKYLQIKDFVKTSHNAALKNVFVASGEVTSKVTQVAYGKLLPGDVVEKHFHPTMEEFFYFKGSGKYIVDGKEIIIIENTFVFIPVNSKHQLASTGSKSLKFLYFGVATD